MTGDDGRSRRRRLRTVVTPEMVRLFLHHAVGGHHGQALALTRELLDHDLPTAEVLDALISTSLGELGDLWHANLLTDKHLDVAANVCDHVLDHVAPRSPGTVTGPAVLVAAVPGEDHVFAARLAQISLVEAGLDVTALGGDVDTVDLEAALRAAAPGTSLLLHATRTAHLPAALDAISIGAAHGVGVAVGGGAFGPDGRWADALGVHCVVDRFAPMADQFPAPPARPDRVEPRRRQAAAELLARAPQLTQQLSRAPYRDQLSPDATGVLDPGRYLLADLAASVVVHDPSLFANAVQWYRGFVTSRGGTIEGIRSAFAEVAAAVGDIGPCASGLAAAAAVLDQ